MEKVFLLFDMLRTQKGLEQTGNHGLGADHVAAKSCSVSSSSCREPK